MTKSELDRMLVSNTSHDESEKNIDGMSWNIFPSVLILNVLPNSVLKTQAKGLKYISLIYLALGN